MLQWMGYSSLSMIAVKNNGFHPMTYAGRHDCLHIREHPSSIYNTLCKMLLVITNILHTILQCKYVLKSQWPLNFLNKQTQQIKDHNPRASRAILMKIKFSLLISNIFNKSRAIIQEWQGAKGLKIEFVPFLFMQHERCK